MPDSGRVAGSHNRLSQVQEKGMTLFSFQRVAEGYATHRPYFHPVVIARIRGYLGLKGKLDKALDVGCGTGLSS